MTTEIHPLYLIGLASEPYLRPPAVEKYIEESEVLAGSDRLLQLFPDYKGRKFTLSLPLDLWLSELKELQDQGLKLAVLTSGDPNYFGLAKQLLSSFNSNPVVIVPSTTVVQQAFAKLKVSWAQTEVVSLHGRTTTSSFWNAIFRASHYPGSGYLAIYTDPSNTPTIIAKRLLGRGQPNWRMVVFEDLGTPDEQITSLTLYEAKVRKFSPLNMVILECLKKPQTITLGMPEEAFAHEAGLITKREVRSVSLGLLNIHPNHTMWDLGSGSGSVSIEAASLLPHGSIWAVEKSPLRTEQIVANRANFGASQVEVVEDDILAAMRHLPLPDRVFIGGGGPDLGEIIKMAVSKLKRNGVIVANVVTLDALHLATASMTESGLEVDLTQVQVSRSQPLQDTLYLKPINQVWLVRGKSCN